MRPRWHPLRPPRQERCAGGAFRRAHYVPSPRNETLRHNGLVYLAYLLRQEIFALTTLRIVDVVANDALISPPHSTGFVCGIVAFLDRTVPVVDLDADVDRTADGSGGRAHIVILETIGLDRRDFIGILLDGSRMESEARTSHSLLRS